MKKILVLSVLLFITFAIWGQTPNLTVYQVTPDSDTSNDRNCSIASNSKGDILIIFRNNLRGVKYYFKKNGAATGTINEVPNELSPESEGWKIQWMSVRATQDNIFHAAWCNAIPYGGGLNYATFNPTTETWSAIEKVVNGWIEDINLRVNPLNGDLLLNWDWYVNGAKNVYVQFKMGGTGPWTNQMIVAPAWATNCLATFDEEGYLYIAWKQDGAVESIIEPAFSLLKKDTNGMYKYLGKVIVTGYSGWHFLPTVAAVEKKGFMAAINEQMREYRYLPFERNGDAIITNLANFKTVTAGPGRWEFPCIAMPWGEEILFSYKDPATMIKMLRYKDGAFINEPAIDLNNNRACNWVYDTQEDPNIGVLTVWATREEPSKIFYSVWDNPLLKVKSAILIGVPEKTILRSFFRMRYIYIIRWENNPFNVEKGVIVTQFNIYRKNKGSNDAWTQIASVPFDTGITQFSYADKDVTAASNFDYAVTCVDNEGNESKPK